MSISETMPVSFTDSMVRGMIRSRVPIMNNGATNVAIDFDGALDPLRLARAFRLSIQAEPILGSRFVSRLFRPRWQRIREQDIDEQGLLRVCRQVAAQTEVRNNFLLEPIDEEQGPQFKALLLVREEGDQLIIKTSHIAMDGGSMKQFYYLIASLYRRLAIDPEYTPCANTNSRSLRQVFQQYTWSDMCQTVFQQIVKQMANLRVQKPVTCIVERDGSCNVTEISIGFIVDRLRQIKVRSPNQEVSINDLLVTALLRALNSSEGLEDNRLLHLGCTKDLRTFLPAGQRIPLANLSGYFFVTLKNGVGDCFEDTLVHVKSQIDPLKNKGLGTIIPLSGWCLCCVVPKGLRGILFGNFMSFVARHDLQCPMFTNLGIIDDKALDFGIPRVTRVSLPLVFLPPYLVVSSWSFRNELIVQATCPSASPTSVNSIQRLLDTIGGELGAASVDSIAVLEGERELCA